jgi:hypothetical protein
MPERVNEESPAKVMWLYLLKSGGFHSTAEIKKQVDAVYFTNASATAKDLHRSGSVVVRKDGVRNLYGVTASCGLPRGLTLADVLGAVDNSGG